MTTVMKVVVVVVKTETTCSLVGLLIESFARFGSPAARTVQSHPISQTTCHSASLCLATHAAAAKTQTVGFPPFIADKAADITDRIQKGVVSGRRRFDLTSVASSVTLPSSALHLFGVPG